MDEGIIHKLKRLSIHSPVKMVQPSLILSDDEINYIIAITSSPVVTAPLPVVASSTTSTTTVVPALTTRVIARPVSNKVTNSVEQHNQSKDGSPTVLSATTDDLPPEDNVVNESTIVSIPSSDKSPDTSSPAHSTSGSDFSAIDSSSLPSPVASTASPASSPSGVSNGSSDLFQSSIHTPPRKFLSKSLPDPHEPLDSDDSFNIEKEFDLLKRVVQVSCSSHDLQMEKMRNDLQCITTSVQNWVTDFVADTRKNVEKFVNNTLSEFIECKRTIRSNTEDQEKVMAEFTAKNKILEQLIKDNQRISDQLKQKPEPVVNPNPNVDADVLHRMENLEKELHKLDVRVLECEQYSRRESVVISGIPRHVQQGELEDVALGIFKELGIHVYHSDISAIHRLGNNTSRYPARVIVRFVNRKFADLCFNRRDQLPALKNTLKMNLRFYESLASLNQESLRIANHLVEDGAIKKCFLRNGFVKIVTNNSDTPVRVNHPNILKESYIVPDNIVSNHNS